MKEIKKQVQHIAECLSNPDLFDADCFEDGEVSAFNYLADVLDIEYIVSGDGTYPGARVLVTSGRPDIWINTKDNIVEGYWWNDKHFESYNDELGLDEVLEELWECR